MTITLVVPQQLFDDVEAASRIPVETAGVLIATYFTAPNGDTRLLAQSVAWVDEAAYLKRTPTELIVKSEGYVPALAEAAERGAVCLWLHTHPGKNGIPSPSLRDEKVDREIAELFRIRTNSDFYGTIIVSPREQGIAFSGTVQFEGFVSEQIDRLWVVGDAWHLTRSTSAASIPLSPIFSRSVLAFGAAVQETLGDLRVAVVGCGGTGSAVAEQLVRLGVRHLQIFDADTLSDTNVTRVYGSRPNDVKKPKVEILKQHLTTIAPSLDCQTSKRMITLKDSAKRLTSCDLVFGCTDDNAGRMVLSRLSFYFLTPIIDVGVMLSSDAQNNLVGIDGRVTTLTPGTACLVCRNRVDLLRAASELKTPEERKRLVAEGYAPALGNTEPAVVAFTTAVAAAALNELLERLIGYGPTPRPSEVLLRMHDREISTNVASPRAGHYCDPTQHKHWTANREPFLEQLWPTN
jgi:molybdopterin/thiamine biosynthesis adenylyltransferase